MSLRTWSLFLMAGLAALAVFRPGLPIDLNSDALYLDDLWLSLSEGAGWASWYFPPAPSFFPDLGLVILLSGARDLPTRHGLYGLALLFALAWCLSWLGRRRFGMAPGESWACGLAGAGLAGAGLCWAPPLQDLLRPAHHTGALLGGLILVALAPSAERPASLGDKLAACALTALAGFSDRLFYAWAVLPLLVVQASRPRQFWTRPRLVWWLWVAGGWLLAEGFLMNLRGTQPPTVARVRWDFWLNHLAGEDLAGQVRRLGELTAASGPLGLSAILWLGLRTWRLRVPGKESEAQAEVLAFSALSGVASIVLGLFLGNVLGRYSYPLFLFPALLLPFVLRQELRLALPAAAACVLVLLALPGSGRLGVWVWDYPKDAQLLDVALEGRGLGNGIADYWHARRLRLTARSHPRLLPVMTYAESGAVAPYFWIVDASLFLRSEGGPKIDFALIDGLDKAVVLSGFGPPKRQILSDGHELWVYR